MFCSKQFLTRWNRESAICTSLSHKEVVGIWRSLFAESNIFIFAASFHYKIKKEIASLSGNKKSTFCLPNVEKKNVNNLFINKILGQKFKCTFLLCKV